MKKKISIFVILFVLLGLFYDVPCICQESIEKSNSDLSKNETGSFTDPRDGKTYETVKVGDQWIMAENFAYKPDSGNYWAYDNVDSNIAIYGYLYDWETAMNIAPEGWHLPSRKEWNAIRKSLGTIISTFSSGKKLYPKLVVGGSSGLDMLLGGMRTCNGEFKHIGNKAMFWISDDTGSEKTMYGLNSKKDGDLGGSTAPYASYNEYQKRCRAYSVRLFKD